MAPEQQNAPKEAPIDAPKNLRVEPLNPEDPAYKEASEEHQKAKEDITGETQAKLGEFKKELSALEDDSGEVFDTPSTPDMLAGLGRVYKDDSGEAEGEASATENLDGEAEGEDTTPHTMPKDTPEDNQKS